MFGNYIVQILTEESSDPQEVVTLASDPEQAVKNVKDLLGESTEILEVHLYSAPNGSNLLTTPEAVQASAEEEGGGPGTASLAEIWRRMIDG